MNSIKGLSKKVLLVILDGFGINPDSPKNAIEGAQTPHFDELFSSYPSTTINASGVHVGLPKGIMGNSEVGHMNLGAGRAVTQDLVRINKSITEGTFSTLPKLKELIEKAKASNGRVHLLGLLSDGGVHSHIDHIEEIIKVLKSNNIEVFLHAFMDGRDTPPKSGANYLKRINKVEGFTFASMQGRSWGMDRDRRWEKIKKAYDTFTGKGEVTDLSPMEYLKSEYKKEIYDEFVTPMLFNQDYAIGADDCVFFVNYRPDRAIQISLAFNLPEFNEFERSVIPKYYLCMGPYVEDQIKLPILFNKEMLSGVLSEYLAEKDLKQFKIAETEKYAHITFFFNGGKKDPFDGEDQILIPSPREVATYDQKPEMSALLVLDKLVETINQDKYDFFLVNFANSDMVGHTGNYKAAVSSIETLDHCIGQLMKKCEEKDIALVLTSDHGNSDQMAHHDGTPHTAHTTALVPFSLFHKSLKNKILQLEEGDLALQDVAPTILELMDLPIPNIFSGKPIFK
ncbi:MAG: 2,3-bisphosphoglycerate-independent phosphoglycerate mutase [Epsilonproteobacteria bacterium]|nr:MAG: 2,3-bisphosphoglycerate-independent phosphoglycerate mutase [Campylobacterota bacterium]